MSVASLCKLLERDLPGAYAKSTNSPSSASPSVSEPAKESELQSGIAPHNVRNTPSEGDSSLMLDAEASRSIMLLADACHCAWRAVQLSPDAASGLALLCCKCREGVPLHLSQVSRRMGVPI